VNDIVSIHQEKFAHELPLKATPSTILTAEITRTEENSRAPLSKHRSNQVCPLSSEKKLRETTPVRRTNCRSHGPPFWGSTPFHQPRQHVNDLLSIRVMVKSVRLTGFNRRPHHHKLLGSNLVLIAQPLQFRPWKKLRNDIRTLDEIPLIVGHGNRLAATEDVCPTATSR